MVPATYRISATKPGKGCTMNMIRLILLLVSVFGLLTAQVDVQLDRVSNLLGDRQITEAKVILEKLYKENDADPRVNYYLGVASLMENNYDDAIDYLDVAIEGDDINPQYYFMLGNAYGVKAQRSGIFKAMFAVGKIKSNWEKAIELKPDFIEAYINLFQFHLQAPGIAGGSLNDAMEIIKKVTQLHKNLGHALKANYELINEKYPEAESELREALKTDSSDAYYQQILSFNLNLLNTFGYHYLNRDMMSKSRRYFSLAIQTAPDRANPYDSMGDYYVQSSAYDSALTYYEKALKINPDFSVSRLNKGKMLEKLNRRSEAIEVYNSLIKDAPGSSYAQEAEDRLEEIEQ